MNWQEIKEIAEKRTKGEWRRLNFSTSLGTAEYDIADFPVAYSPPERAANLEFLHMMHRKFEYISAVVDAAKTMLPHINRDYAEWTEPLYKALEDLDV